MFDLSPKAMTEKTMRGLIKVWTDFESRLSDIPIIDKLERGKFRTDDYKIWLLNHRQQVVEGSRWIARAAASVNDDYLEQRSTFMQHAVTEHRDYQMLEQHYVDMGGTLDEIRHAPKNIGSEALHSYMMHQSSLENPFHLLGAMFIIEGLGQRKAGEWGAKIRDQLNLTDKEVSFFIYHAENDEDHMTEFEEILYSGILDIEGMSDKIIQTAKIVARLYEMQLAEMGNY